MIDQVKEYLLTFLDMLVLPIDPDYQVEMDRNGDQYHINLITTKEVDLIGQGEKYDSGEVLNSIQHIIRVLVHKRLPEDRTNFIIDVNSNKKKRESMILQKIPYLAKYDVLEHGKTVIIVGLTSYERLQVHKLLQGTKGLNTTSVGSRGDRKLIIIPTSDVGSGGMESAKVVNFKNNLE